MPHGAGLRAGSSPQARSGGTAGHGVGSKAAPKMGLGVEDSVSRDSKWAARMVTQPPAAEEGHWP